jgi:hypothetical protein
MSIDLDFSSLFRLMNYAWRNATRDPHSIACIAAFKGFMGPIARYGGIICLVARTQGVRSSVVRTLLRSKRSMHDKCSLKYCS